MLSLQYEFAAYFVDGLLNDPPYVCGSPDYLSRQQKCDIQPFHRVQTKETGGNFLERWRCLVLYEAEQVF